LVLNDSAKSALSYKPTGDRFVVEYSVLFSKMVIARFVMFLVRKGGANAL
jgi:hypothetical protein